MFLGWIPWKFIVRHMARRHGFIDPLNVLARLDAFSHPSEVAAPIELLRAGVVFHARGLINTRVIQQNLDWKWPYWVRRQFDPRSDSFVPRAFSITHVNLTHRNWTAIGLPDCLQMPIGDPRGLMTPFFDGWSLEGWIVGEGDEAGTPRSALIPAETDTAVQRLEFEDSLALVTEVADELDRGLGVRAEVVDGPKGPVCRIEFEPRSRAKGTFAVVLRPYNPEGISFVQHVAVTDGGAAWSIDHRTAVAFAPTPERTVASNYHDGDVFHRLLKRPQASRIDCNVGMATAAALFPLEPGEAQAIRVEIPLNEDPVAGNDPAPPVPNHSWKEALAGACVLQVPDETIQRLYDEALRTLVLLSPLEVYPGPYTYKRFWFRDAVLMLNGMLAAGLTDRVERTLNEFPKKQALSGFFHSQDGEWDSNGQVLWFAERFQALSGRKLGSGWKHAICKGAEWIMRKRVSRELDVLHAGLLPAGFSAEHFGNNDFYYWDDFWGVAGLRAAATLCEGMGLPRDADTFSRAAADFMDAIERSLARSEPRRGRPGFPASPYRRLDAGAVGSLVAGYPLQLCEPADPRLLDTAAFLLDRCTVHDAFFQDMIHSGINIYLTLHLAQVLLRAGDDRFLDLVASVASLASPAGQWPEAIHPRTGGGCMGDGQHGWAAAEWVMMLRNMFVREEGEGLVLGSGIPANWLEEGAELHFGPTPTPQGPVTVSISQNDGTTRVRWSGSWRSGVPPLSIHAPGAEPVTMNNRPDGEVVFRQAAAGRLTHSDTRGGESRDTAS